MFVSHSKMKRMACLIRCGEVQSILLVLFGYQTILLFRTYLYYLLLVSLCSPSLNPSPPLVDLLCFFLVFFFILSSYLAYYAAHQGALKLALF